MENYSVAELEHLYESLTPSEDANKCTYCGGVATDIEHVIPRSFFHTDGKKRLTYHASKNNLVWSCRECNILAGTEVFANFWDKKKFIAERVEKRHARILYMAEWTDAEIAELDGLLRRYVFTAMKVKEKLWARLENLNSPQIF